MFCRISHYEIVSAASTIMDIEQILKALRKNSGMNLHDFVTKSGISRAWVYKLERGDVPSPSVVIVKKWLQAAKPAPEQVAETAEWFRLGMLILFNNDDMSDSSKSTAVDQDATATTDDGPKIGWFARVLKTKLSKGK